MSESETPEPTPMRLPPTIRNFTGWLALTAFVLLLAVSAIFESAAQPKSKEVPFSAEMVALETAVNMREVGQQMGTPAASRDLRKQTDEMLVPLVSDLVDAKDTSTRAALIYAAARTEQGKTIKPEDIKPLVKSKVPADLLAAEVYTSTSLTLARAKVISDKLPREPSIYKIVRIHAFEKAGDKLARGRIADPAKAVSSALALVAVAAIMGASLLVWSMYSAYRSQGLVRPLGFPNFLQAMIDADRYALLAAMLLVGLIIAQVVVQLATRSKFDDWASGALTSLTVVATTLVVLRTRVIGQVITFRQLGLSRDRLRQMIFWGLGGFVAELPISLMLLGVGTKLFPFLPPPEHPATTALEKNHQFLPVVAILVYGVMVAPFVEEIIFRGLLFPALHRLSGSVVTAALGSGFVFAMIHPQGPIMWLALANVGVMSCVLFYHTRSLVPSLVMHAAHNLTLMVVTLLISKT